MSLDASCCRETQTFLLWLSSSGRVAGRAGAGVQDPMRALSTSHSPFPSACYWPQHFPSPRILCGPCDTHCSCDPCLERPSCRLTSSRSSTTAATLVADTACFVPTACRDESSLLADEACEACLRSSCHPSSCCSFRRLTLLFARLRMGFLSFWPTVKDPRQDAFEPRHYGHIDLQSYCILSCMWSWLSSLTSIAWPLLSTLLQLPSDDNCESVCMMYMMLMRDDCASVAVALVLRDRGNHADPYPSRRRIGTREDLLQGVNYPLIVKLPKALFAHMQNWVPRQTSLIQPISYHITCVNPPKSSDPSITNLLANAVQV